MSHFTVAVLTEVDQWVEDLLAPFDENIVVEPYIYRTRADIIKDAKNTKERIIKKLEDKEYQLRKDEQEYLQCKTDEDFYNIEARFFEEDEVDEEGNELSTYNPNGKWDWYDIGGRWHNLIKTKDGRCTDSCLVSELDFTPDKEEYEHAIRFWELYVEHQPLKDGESPASSFYKEEYFIQRYKTKENYAKQQASFTTYAVLTPDGKWLEPGKMGWFGMSTASLEEEDNWVKTYENILKEADPNWTITLVDCHI